ncbi:MAG: hypothetical protein HGA45_39675 [Chloroflexales bacterium]|nr:hypothetical protein [Chloroflexales bacterium]
MISIPDGDEAERAMALRLAAEHGIATSCPKCILHHLGRKAPLMRPEDVFSYTDPMSCVYDWPKATLDRVARTFPVTAMPYKRALAILEESSVEPEHVDHLPDEALTRPAIVVEVDIGNGHTRNVFADGNHRATRLARAERPVLVHWIRGRAERQCRATPADFERMMLVAQRNGFFVWELPLLYAVAFDTRNAPRFGRIVGPAEGSAAYFQLATNWAELPVPPDLARPNAVGLVELDLALRPRYDALARAARFSSSLRIGGRELPIMPLPYGAISADAPRIEMRSGGAGQPRP